MTRLFPVDDALDTDAWYTPPWIFYGLGLTFDLDVAAPTSGGFVPARQRLTVSDDGLGQPWYGLVWCNPPYSDPTPWCIRWASHESGGCLLIRSDVSTRGSVAAWSAATSVFIAPGRIAFVNGAGQRVSSVPFSTVLLGRGVVADAALSRLGEQVGGLTRRLVP